MDTPQFYVWRIVADPEAPSTVDAPWPVALLSNKLDVKGKSVVVVLSGGNVDAEMFSRALALK